MAKRNYILTLLTVFGFLLIPNFGFGCESESQKSCCNKEIKPKTLEKDCCNNSKSENENKECGGKCGNSNCTTLSVTSCGIITIFNFVFVNNCCDFSTEKQKFYNPKSFVSKGFLSIWLPPVIS